MRLRYAFEGMPPVINVFFSASEWTQYGKYLRKVCQDMKYIICKQKLPILTADIGPEEFAL